MKVYEKKREEDIKQRDLDSYTLGRYIIHAFHQPKKYPKKPFLHGKDLTKKVDDSEVITENEAVNKMKNIALLLGGKIK